MGRGIFGIIRRAESGHKLSEVASMLCTVCWNVVMFMMASDRSKVGILYPLTFLSEDL